MTIQNSTTLRNNRLDQYETTIGTAPKLQLRTGSQPANCAAADSGTLLCEIDLPNNWVTAASAGSVELQGTWAGTGIAAGTAAHYRLKDSAGTTTHEQGSITVEGGGGDIEMPSVSVAVGAPVSVTVWTRTEGNA